MQAGNINPCKPLANRARGGAAERSNPLRDRLAYFGRGGLATEVRRARGAVGQRTFNSTDDGRRRLGVTQVVEHHGARADLRHIQMLEHRQVLIVAA